MNQCPLLAIALLALAAFSRSVQSVSFQDAKWDDRVREGRDCKFNKPHLGIVPISGSEDQRWDSCRQACNKNK